MKNTSFILPLNAWTYLLGLQKCHSLWCLKVDQPIEPEAGMRYLLEQGLVITDGKSILIDPYLFKLSQVMAGGRWCVHFEYGSGNLSIIVGSGTFLVVKKISKDLYRIGSYDDGSLAFSNVQEEIMEDDWETVCLTLADPLSVLGKKKCKRTEFSVVYRELQKRRAV